MLHKVGLGARVNGRSLVEIKGAGMKKIAHSGIVVAVAVLGISGIALADNDRDDCTLRTLRGTYVFAATGHNIVAGVPQPKAIVEVIEFHGDGTLSVPAATRSVNGVVARSLPGGTGGYTVETGCAGTITFDGPGPTFDVFLSPAGEKLWMIQTNPNTVFQGTATRLFDDESRERDRR
jgi:hypothetical protein